MSDPPASPHIGRYVYAVGGIALGSINSVWGDFATVWEPIQAFGDRVPGRHPLAYAAAACLVLGGLAMLWSRTSRAHRRRILGGWREGQLEWGPRPIGHMRSLYCALFATAVLCAPAAAQGRFEDLTRAFSYDSAAALDVRQQDSAVVARAVVHDISYASPKGGRVPAYLVVPQRAAPFAGVVFVHWGQGNRSEFLAEAVALAERGVESLLIDAPFNRLGDPNRSKPGPEAERDGYIQLVIDVRRGVDLLLTRGDVDAGRLGYVGHSLGATWGGVVAGIDHRLKALVLMGGLPTLTDLDFPDPLVRQEAHARTARALAAYTRVMSQVNPVQFVGHSAPASLFFQWATVDRYISKRAAQAYFEAAADPKRQQWYYCSHEFNDPRARLDRDSFLAAQLGLGGNQ